MEPRTVFRSCSLAWDINSSVPVDFIAPQQQGLLFPIQVFGHCSDPQTHTSLLPLLPLLPLLANWLPVCLEQKLAGRALQFVCSPGSTRYLRGLAASQAAEQTWRLNSGHILIPGHLGRAEYSSLLLRDRHSQTQEIATWELWLWLPAYGIDGRQIDRKLSKFLWNLVQPKKPQLDW